MDYSPVPGGELKRKRNRKSSVNIFLISFTIVMVFFCFAAGSFIGIKGGQYLSSLFTKNTVESSALPDESADPDAEKESNSIGPVDDSENEKIEEVKTGFDESNTAVPYSQTTILEGFSSEVIFNDKIVENYAGNGIIFGGAEDYSPLEGVTCFRGNHYRDSAAFGTPDITEYKLEKVWSKNIGYIDTWTGVGWNGQPAIVKWPDQIKNIMNIEPSKKAKENLKEVIYATLDGNIYFLDLDDGMNTREPINVGSPHKGSVTVDPRGFPILYAGQGIPEVGGQKVPIGFRIFSLIDFKELYFINGMDKHALRYWGAFDSGALIHADTDSFILCGENGILYSGKLNTHFDLSQKTVSISPELAKYRYKSPFGYKVGTESSPVVYKNLIYFADNSGLFQCVDLNSLKTVWAIDVTDDTDSTPVLEVEPSGPYIYTACEVDLQGLKQLEKEKALQEGVITNGMLSTEGTDSSQNDEPESNQDENTGSGQNGNTQKAAVQRIIEGISYIRKINALTGEIVWEKKVKSNFIVNPNGYKDGGVFASPVIGKKDISDIVIFNVSKTGKNNGSTLIALDKKDGREVWSVQLKHYCWSSPVLVYSKNGKSVLIVCDSGGYMHLLEGATGKILDTIPLGGNVEGSPAVYEDMAVVGTRGGKIWGIRIK